MTNAPNSHRLISPSKLWNPGMKKLLLACLCALSLGSVFAQLNMTLTDTIYYQQGTSSLWGYIDPEDSTEYAAVGTRSGVAIVDLTDPYNIQQIAFKPDQNNTTSTWREVKSYGHYVYSVTEAGGGVQVINMTDPTNITSTNWAPNIPGLGTLNSIHSITVDEFGYLYLNGSNLNSGGSLIVDVSADDGNPVYVGKLPAIYCHDSYARNNIFYSSDILAGNFKVYDITDRTNPVLLATQQTPFSFTHNTWLSDDGKTIFTTDEKANAPVGVYDITDLNNIVELDQFRPAATLGTGVIPHNVHVWNDWVITAYYTDGTLVLDGSRPENIIEVGYFDSFVSQTAGFYGIWGVYPYFPSGLVIATDMQNGLMVYDVNYVRACWLEGKVTNSVTGTPISNANVHIESSQANFAATGLTGEYKTGQAIPGVFNVTVSANGYQPKVVSVTLENGVLTILDVELDPISAFSGETVHQSDGTPVPNVQVLLRGPLGEFTATSDAVGNFSFPGVAPGTYTLYAGKWGYLTEAVNNVVIGSGTVFQTVPMSKGYQDEFLFDLGWTTAFTATTGFWDLGEPVGTVNQNNQANPDLDLPTDFGDQCYVTGNDGGGAGDDDVDNGTVTLTSPMMDLSNFNDPVIKFTPWFFNGGGQGSPNDNMTVKISNGSQVVTLQTITQSASAWKPEVEIQLLNFIPLTSNMQVIFEATDNAPGHLVEAAVDGFRVDDTSLYPVFSASGNSGCLPFSVQFTDSSDSTFLWNWSFPGGTPSTSTEQNPIIVYNEPGVYDVSLTVITSMANSYTIERPSFITVGAPPTGSFTYNVIGNVANFNSITTLANSIIWNFGDGSTSNQANPIHTFNALGDYTVTLAVTNDCGTVNYTQVVSITVLPPVASFTTTTTTGCAPFTVNYTSTSTNAPATHLWNFPGGSPSVSSEPNPVVVYLAPGTYSAQLTVTNAAGSSTSTLNQAVVVNAAPNALFGLTVNGFDVIITNSTTNATTYAWDFGDGTTSTVANPSHTYTSEGDFVITLTASNGCGSTVFTQSLTIGTNSTDYLDEKSYQLVASPNPFAERLTINYAIAAGSRDAKLLIFNVFGQEIGSQSLQSTSGSLQFDEQLKTSGVYFIRLQVDGRMGKAIRVIRS